MGATSRLVNFENHETTANLIANSVLTLLRHPDAVEKLRRRPELIVTGVEEFVRVESSVQFWRSRTALEEIEIAGTTIPKGADHRRVRVRKPRPQPVQEPGPS